MFFFYHCFAFLRQTPESGLKDQISEKLWNKLSRGQQDMLLESEKKRRHPDVDETVVTPIVKEVAKMQVPQTESAGWLCWILHIFIF